MQLCNNAETGRLQCRRLCVLHNKLRYFRIAAKRRNMVKERQQSEKPDASLCDHTKTGRKNHES